MLWLRNLRIVRHQAEGTKRKVVPYRQLPGLARHSLSIPSMSLCASCGLQLSGDAGLCPHHHCVYGDDWAVANRIMCDFFHRRKVPPRLAQTERDDDFWAHTGEAA
jgi:hypothetical protein